MKFRSIPLVGALVALLTILVVAPAAAAGPTAGAVYTLTNSAAGNAVIAYSRSSNGSLSPLGTFATGGLGGPGVGGGQGSVTLSGDGRWLLAVNAGSDEITSFAVGADHRLAFADRIWSGGDHPISVTIGNGLVYTVNDGGSGNIAGFSISPTGALSAIAGSIQSLSSSSSGPAEISFTPDGGVLVVTEKATNRITTYAVGGNGAAGAPTSVTSAGPTPFGFGFDNKGHLIVSEAFGGAPNASAVSSYDLSNGSANLIDGPVPTTETAACWVVVTNNGKYAYASNTGSGSISGFGVANNGSLDRLDSDGVTGFTGGAPTDMSLSSNSKFLYARVGATLHAF
ncbi:MAG TPA: beta-propeller fold lactonase family protein, partial [Candidatus Limnocylindrales bacterium]|nr:beta-propeller fold lactonase family protein [Candidatus Limnocylindrales bacterium]